MPITRMRKEKFPLPISAMIVSITSITGYSFRPETGIKKAPPKRCLVVDYLFRVLVDTVRAEGLSCQQFQEDVGVSLLL